MGVQPDSDQTGPGALPEAPRYLNRELSRLDFDERVLAMAEDPKLPVLERVRFLAIFSQNLDDFFQVRVAGLKEQVLAAVAVASPDGMSPLEQLRVSRTRAWSTARLACSTATSCLRWPKPESRLCGRPTSPSAS